MSDIRIEVEQTSTGWSAYSPDVLGVGVTGSTRAEAERVLRDAIAFHLEGLALESVVFSGAGSSFINSVHTTAVPAGQLVRDLRRVAQPRHSVAAGV